VFRRRCVMLGRLSVLVIGLSLGLASAVALKRVLADEGESERQVKESEVPPAALQALKKLAGGAAITEFAEEVEHGSKFYEGSWKGPGGNVDGLVTENGDVVEIEEAVSADAVPASVRKTAQREAGDGAKLAFEKKTYILYEVKFKKGDRGRELLLTPYGSRPHEEDEDDEDEDEEDDKK
jgi:hypothetical protein